MKLKIITVGKLKEKYLKEGVAEYQKRLNRFSKIETIELADEKTPDKASISENQRILDIEGKQLPSESFSHLIDQKMISGYSTITFVIGGSLGLSQKVKKRADYLMSFGLLTLPHQLMKLVLMEQIYRAFMIRQGTPYHK
ncbi:TPA: 23S rRNA (pseudouridine(1915)-N(3))-methyltransferase RlmH [Streptococcus agalactiae]|nr:23S rRNA (pseudouridine(1915)-N(3))-methyltransferase RlmH [Streptococcus agalactiae]HEO4005757.1 23S rRNA (pseudouridine(1915)-N(3))-methyltransferase RlmH [Streptococcus agalactiae]